MSLFQNVIGSKTNFVRFDKNNTLTGENSFNGVVNLNGDVNGLVITDIENLQSELQERATTTQLESETEQRLASDTLLQLNIGAVQSNLNAETISRADADNTLQDNIDVVQLNLDNETTDRLNRDSDILNELQLESLARTSADTLITNNLTNEETARIAADAIITDNLNLKANQTSISNIDNTSDADKPVSNATQTALDLKSNLASPTFTGTVKIEKQDNYGHIELTDTKSVAAGVGGGITFNGVYGAGGQITAFANIKAKKSNSTIGDYHGDLSLSVREHLNGGYTEIIKLKGEDLKTIITGGLNIVNLPTSSLNLVSGDIWNNNGILSIIA